MCGDALRENILNTKLSKQVMSSGIRTSEVPCWLEAIVVVVFHVEHGQIVEDVFMTDSNKWLSDTVKRKICSLSLPDSNSGQNGDVQFMFRIRVDESRSLDRAVGDDFMYGCAFFRQIKEKTYKRGYFQKSVVLVSKHPYSSFLCEGAYVIGPLFFEYGKTVMTAVMNNINCWPPPQPGNSYELDLAGSQIRVTVPFIQQSTEFGDALENIAGEKSDDQFGRSQEQIVRRFSFSSNASVEDHQVAETKVYKDRTGASAGLYQDVQLFATFGGLSVALWHVWELALCGAPILVLAPTPDACSQAVLAIASLVAPLTYRGDYRPYFTIYDADFMHISRCHDQLRGQDMPSYVLGVTNPYFLKSFEFWPNVLSMGGSVPPTPVSNAQDSPRSLMTRTPNSMVFQRTDSLSVVGRDIRTSTYLPTVAKRSTSLNALLTDQKYEHSVILTRDEPLVPPNPNILKKLLDTSDEARSDSEENFQESYARVEANNQVLRQHFRSLTLAFLEPLENYMKLESVASRVAKDAGLTVDAYQVMPLLPEVFDLELFFQDIDSKKYDLPKEIQKIEWRLLYRKFVQGPNFPPWFKFQKTKLEIQLQSIYKHLRMNVDVDFILQEAGVDNPKGLDLLNRVKAAIKKERSKPQDELDEELCVKMQEHLAIVASFLNK